METALTGSSDITISSMHFMKSGELVVEGVNLDDITSEDFSTLALTQEFIMYALQRDDWMVHFLTVVDNLKKSSKDQKKINATVAAAKATKDLYEALHSTEARLDEVMSLVKRKNTMTEKFEEVVGVSWSL